jgi:hypothetical protein
MPEEQEYIVIPAELADIEVIGTAPFSNSSS